mmetsp:Transcript_52052/g.60815  ORF Transcript_52052/g.60815 Transcript_52052/m.60815 type:complete len:90 (-) Transcript_52052:71-340(-)
MRAPAASRKAANSPISKYSPINATGPSIISHEIFDAKSTSPDDKSSSRKLFLNPPIPWGNASYLTCFDRDGSSSSTMVHSTQCYSKGER